MSSCAHVVYKQYYLHFYACAVRAHRAAHVAASARSLLVLYGPVETASAELDDDWLIGGVKLFHLALPHHLPLMQKDDSVARAADGRVLVRDHDVRNDLRIGVARPGARTGFDPSK